jgi:transcriptional regulator GlxA family with amidase domain
MPYKIAFLIYDGVAELDFVGPKDVLFASKYLGQQDDVLYTVAASKEPVTCLGGLRVIPDHDFNSAPLPDILVIPGSADPSPQLSDRQLLDWIIKADQNSRWTTGVCTGTAILIAAGPAGGRRVTSHWSQIETLRAQNQAHLIDNERYVVDGKLVTSAGVSAGIDMALWLVGQLRGPEHAREVQRLLEYYPAPPYQQ